jgi:putative inorganic carbon (HCO3(-)) transporter
MARHLFAAFSHKAGKKKMSGLAARIFLEEKLNNWVGYFFMACLACVFGVLGSIDVAAGLLLFGVLVAVLLLIVFMSNPEFCFYFLLFYAFWISFFNACLFHVTLMIGVPYDIMAFLLFLALMAAKPEFRRSLRSFTRIPLVGFYFLVVFTYNLLEIFNPGHVASSNTATLVIRKYLDFFIILFAAYALLNSFEKIRKFTNILLIAAGVSALYGCIQQWHGLYPWDYDGIMSNPKAYALLFINGDFRKFGTMADPAIYGILMAACALYFLILALYEKDKGLRFLYIVAVILMILAVGYSGTRTAYATLLIGLAFFILLNIAKPAIRRLAIFAIAAYFVLMYGPGAGIATIRRFRTTFSGTQDESYKVRMQARAFIQPFIRSHPFGGGLGTTNGDADQNDHSGSPLAGFQTDGAFVARATEQGYIGLALNCILYFMVMQAGIKGFFRARDPMIKVYYSACLSAIFSLYIGEYTQAAVGGVTDSLFYFPMIGIMLNLKYLDKPALGDADNAPKT